MALTLLQQPNAAGFPKPGELIEIGGAHELTAADRVIVNALYQHAHDSGRLDDPFAEWEIPLAALKFSASHKGVERVSDSLERLMKVSVRVPLYDARTGEPRVLRTHLFDFFDSSEDENSAKATVRYGLPKKLQPLLAHSSRWGRIRAEVVCGMRSRYSIALYELVQLRSNRQNCVEVFTLDDFRDLLGVPPGKLTTGTHLMQKVVAPALAEVNGLSDTGVRVELRRKSPRAPIDRVEVAWWAKAGDELREAYQEQQRPKADRTRRLRAAGSRQ